MKPLRVENLRVQLDNGRSVIADIQFELSAGEILGLVGESGSGKTTLATALLGHVRKGAQLTEGRVIVAGVDLLSLQREALRNARGGLIAYIPQDPAMALNPALRIVSLLQETLAAHAPTLSRAARQQRLRDTLKQVGLPDDAGFLRRFAHQLSGGQQQRVLLALAFILRPKVVVLDEPTTALDVTTQAHFLASLRQLCKIQGVAAVYVSHDLAVVKSLADRVMVLYAGRVVECAETAQLFRQPAHPYSQRLVAAATLVARPSTSLTPQPVLLAVSELAVSYAGRPVVEGVSLQLHPGECLALVGESGSGKSSVSRALVGLAQDATGQLQFAGEPLSLTVGARPAEQRRRIQYIFQNSLRALNPRHTVAQSLATPLWYFFCLKGAALRQRIEQALLRVALPVAMADAYPGSLSGGERQRVAIARALVCEPRLLICDEITSALDVSVQASILALLRGLQDEGMALLFVTHDLNLVRAVADRVAVLKDGRLVEQGTVAEVFEQPRAAYTRQLLEQTL
ncbi:ABC transporter ATP-binding protein [Pseudomonas sp. W22_MBD1_FP4]|uniref:ABC transporter ATP-binding protein n=1 Tax=Pseudomonas sp. W22_MBD1_FP4 TaxID=3240272 RepID=UPI003F946255